MELETVIQWFPGHMVKAKKMVRENLKIVDIVIELVDARIPSSSRNPDLQEILQGKPRVVALNKADLADQNLTERWTQVFTRDGCNAVAINSTTGQGVEKLVALTKKAGEPVMQKLAAKGRKPRPIRVMILGIPNVGKSSLINKLAGKGATRTGDRPGVTRGKQWIRVGRDMELLDTPGILWPKFDDPEVGFKLAVTGAIKEEVINVEQVVLKLLKYLKDMHPEKLKARYKLDSLSEKSVEILADIGARRGLLIPGGQVDMEKAARVILAEFRTGKLGRFTLDLPGS